MKGAFCSPEWLQARLDDPGVRIIEASIAKETYDAGHIPGALWVDFHADLLVNGDDSAGHVITPEQYSALMSRLGVTRETTVVWYGDRHSSYAMRGFWMMDYYRHAAPVYVLDGGRERWTAARRPLTSAPAQRAASDYPRPERIDAANEATLEHVRGAIGREDAVILDVRAPAEYSGENVRAKRGGHIPGAVNIEWTQATAGDNVLKSAVELRAMYESAGVTPEKDVIVHCQLGIRAAHTWFVLKHVLGYPSVRNYDGSWAEWGNRDDTSIEL